MTVLSKYCKLYPASDLERFAAWRVIPNSEDATRLFSAALAGEADASAKYYFLHDTYIVTAGIFLDSDVVFDQITPEWIEFCKGSLSFDPLEAEQPKDVLQADPSA